MTRAVDGNTVFESSLDTKVFITEETWIGFI